MMILSDDPKVLLSELGETQTLLIEREYELRLEKNEYDVHFIELSNSEEYVAKHKTIKAREQEATVQLEQEKKDLLQLEMEVNKLKGQVRLIEWQLKFLLKGDHVEV